MSRLNSFCAFILLITYYELCTAENTVEPTSHYSQYSSKLFRPIKLTQNQALEDVTQIFASDIQTNEGEYTDKTSTIQTNDLTNSMDSEDQYETTELNSNDLPTSNIVSTKNPGNEADRMPQFPITSEELSNRRMAEHVHETVTETAINENFIHEVANISAESDDDNNNLTTTTKAIQIPIRPRPESDIALIDSNFSDYPTEQVVVISWKEVDNSHLQRSQSLVAEELNADEPEPVDIDTVERYEFIPRHFQFPTTEEDDLIDGLIEESNVTALNEVDGMMGRNTLQAVTKIELGVQSQLLASPGQTVQIYYEVTNLREEPTFHNFQVVDEKRFLRALSPMSMWLAAGQTQSAIVTVYIPPNAQIGDKDKITFTSQGIGLASQAATLTVTSATAIQDTRQPSMWWGFGSRCEGRTGAGQCASSVWSLEVSTQDTDTGILRIQSRPPGIIVRNAFTAGTTSEVKATYTSSCCTTRVTITSYDLAGNQRSHTVDVTEFILNEASIAAISLGVVLLIILICLAVGLIVWCCKKRKASRELPVYRTRGERERSA